jgi:hypothetical protein
MRRFIVSAWRAYIWPQREGDRDASHHMGGGGRFEVGFRNDASPDECHGGRTVLQRLIPTDTGRWVHDVFVPQPGECEKSKKRIWKGNRVMWHRSNVGARLVCALLTTWEVTAYPTVKSKVKHA